MGLPLSKRRGSCSDDEMISGWTTAEHKMTFLERLERSLAAHRFALDPYANARLFR